MKQDREKTVWVLNQFLDGEVNLNRLSGMLSDYISFDFKLGPSYREITKNHLQDDIKIPVSSKHIETMLRKFIANEVTGSELSDWAAFIFLSMVYVPEGNTENEKEAAGEGPVWDILQRLITPEIFDGLDNNIAKMYLSWLIKM